MRVHVRPPCGRLMRQFLGAWFAPEPYDVAIEPHQELWAEHSSLELTVDGRKMEEVKAGGSLGMPQYRVTSRNAAGVAERCEHAAPPVATYTEPPSEDIRHGDSLFYDGALWIWDDSRGHRGQWWREDAKHYSPSDHPPSPWEVADELEAAKKAEPPRSSLSDMIKAALPKDKPRCDSCTYGPRDRECIECLYPDSNYKAKHGGVLAKGQSDPSMNGMYYPPVFPERKCSNCADFRGVGFGWRKRTVAEPELESDAELRARALAKMARDWGAFCNVPLVDNIETATGAALDKICVANGVRRGSK